MSMRIGSGGAWRGWWAAPAVVLMILGWASLASAQSTPERFPQNIGALVTDLGNVLPEADQQALESRLERLRAETGVTFAIVTISGIPGGAAQLESYATGLFNAWGIGNLDRNDGILLLYSAPDKAVRLELGQGYGQDFDRVAQGIVDRVLVPELREGRIPKAMSEGVTQVIERIALPFVQRATTEGAKSGTSDWTRYGVPGVMVLAFAAIALRKRRGAAGPTTCPQCGTNLSMDHGPILSNGRKRLVSCPDCGWAGRIPARALHERPDRGPGRDHEGLGGGSSGGGGASGRW